MVRYTLSKEERLTSLKEIDRLFSEGNSLSKFPLRIVWNEEASREIRVKALFSVPKKKFPKAVDRNRLKRLLRESYRLYKPILLEKLPDAKTFNLALVYTANEILDFQTIQKSLEQIMDRFIKHLTSA